jgi:superfamily II DNA or RNA helicase
VPEQTYREHKVEQTADQKKAIKDIALEFPDPLVLTGKRHQIENGVLKGDDFSPDVTICDLKTEAILDFALEFPKMVIFTKYTQQIEKIKDALKDYKVLTLQGSTKDRENVLKDAEASDECIIIIQSQISAGYELPSFPVVVFASMSYSVVDRIQAEGRVLRANALKKNLYITLVTKGGVDEAVNKSINNKVDFSEKIYAQERG